MISFIFYTFEGFTIAPNNEELESMQILGFEKGEDLEDATNKLIENNPWILKSGFTFEKIKSKKILE